MDKAEIFLSFTSPPRVLYLFCDFLNDKKYKYIVLLSKDNTEILFFLINSKSYTISQQDEIKITPHECSFLHHDSYIDCRQVFVLPIDHFSKKISTNLSGFDKGAIEPAIVVKILSVVESSDTISPLHKKKILDTLGSQ